jgi:tRNA (cytidine/uridine-2'-O-)-methyltransferase
MRIALFQPDIAQNTGTLLRLGACLNIPVDIIEPCGFRFNSKEMKRAGMDYLDKVDYKKHISWEDFLEYRNENPKEYGRIILLSTKASEKYYDFKFKENDILLLGRESCGAPEEVHEKSDARVIIPMHADTRSINIAISASMVLGEAMRQCDCFPK